MTTPGPVLLTGASAGIGRELALVFASHGHDLVIVARSRDRLEALAEEVRGRHGRRVDVVVADLTADGAAARVFDEVTRLGVSIDVLVNNAGAAEIMAFDRADPALIDRLLQLNVVVLTQLSRLFLEPMVKRGRGRVLNVASMAAFQPVPRMAVYGATKAFVLSLTEALSTELAGSGVHVSAICPGFVDTGMVQHFADGLGRSDFVPRFLLLDAAAVARQAYRVCMGRRVVAVSGAFYAVLVQSGRWLPRSAVRRVSGLLARHYAG